MKEKDENIAEQKGVKGFRKFMEVVNKLPLDKYLKEAEDLLSSIDEGAVSEESDSKKINKLADNNSPEKSGKGSKKDNNEQENNSAMATILKLVIKLLKMAISTRPVVNSLYGNVETPLGHTPDALVATNETLEEEIPVPKDATLEKQKLPNLEFIKNIIGELDPDEFKILFDHLLDIAVEDGELTPNEEVELLNVGIQGGLGTEDEIRAIVGKKLILRSIQTEIVQ